MNLYFEIKLFGEATWYGQVTEPVGTPTGQNSDSLESIYNSTAYEFPAMSHFSQNPHLIGTEGACMHLKLEANVPLAQVLVAAIALDPSRCSAGKGLNSLDPIVDIQYDRSNYGSPPIVYYKTSSSSSAMYFSHGSGAPVSGSTYSFSQVTQSSGSMGTYANVGEYYHYDNTVFVSSGQWMMKHHEERVFDMEASDAYKIYLNSFAYNPYYRFETHQNGSILTGISDWCDPIAPESSSFISVPDDLLVKADRLLQTGCIETSFGLPKLKVPDFPIEESFLEDLYAVLDRPTMNSYATIIECIGSVRNLKNVSSVCRKIKKAGGIRNLLAQEGSDLLAKGKKLKTASDAYLTKKYLYDTTKMDIDDFYKKLLSRSNRSSNPVQHFRYSNWNEKLACNVDHCIRIAYRPPEQSWADLYGFDLPLEATWDIIPYSFVVDWFCNIGTSLESIEQVEALQKLDVMSCTESVRAERTSVEEVSLTEDLKIPIAFTAVSYNRVVYKTIPPVYPKSPSISNPFHHIIDGAALFFSKKKD